MEIGNIIGISFVIVVLLSVGFLSYQDIENIKARDTSCTDLGGETTESGPIQCLINDTLHPIVKFKSGWRVIGLKNE